MKWYNDLNEMNFLIFSLTKTLFLKVGQATSDKICRLKIICLVTKFKNKTQQLSNSKHMTINELFEQVRIKFIIIHLNST